MLSWQVGIETNFSVSVGKSCKYLNRYLSPAIWERLLTTYRLETARHIAAALSECLALFRESSHFVAEQLGFPYPAAYDIKVSAYIADLRIEM
jgi:aminoglycoside 6-adenylyltransferase